jgi:hypothetical protein
LIKAKLISVNIRVVEHPEIVLTQIEYGDTMNNADGTFSAWLESPVPIPVSSTISVEYIYDDQTNIDLLVNVGNPQNGRQSVGRICWGATRACKAISFTLETTPIEMARKADVEAAVEARLLSPREAVYALTLSQTTLDKFLALRRCCSDIEMLRPI